MPTPLFRDFNVTRRRLWLAILLLLPAGMLHAQSDDPVEIIAPRLKTMIDVYAAL